MSDAKVLKPHLCDAGRIVDVGDTLKGLTDQRHDDLAAVGLVEPRVGSKGPEVVTPKAKPVPDNKMKPAPANKRG